METTNNRKRLLALLFSCLACALPVAGRFRPSYTYKAANGEEYFYTPVSCVFGATDNRDLDPMAFSEYTTRRDRNCCYSTASRNLCCVSMSHAQGAVCKCSAITGCGLPSAANTAQPLAATPGCTSTTAPCQTTTPPCQITPTPPKLKTIKSTTITKTTATTTPTTTTTTTATTTPTATTTTTANTTPTTMPTTKNVSLCSHDLTPRILYGTPVVNNSCNNAGIANIRLNGFNQIYCNAILTRAKVNGELKATFVTVSTCLTFIKQGLDYGLGFTLQLGKDAYNITSPLFNLINGSEGLGFVDFSKPFSSLFSFPDVCFRPACNYNPKTMAGKVDFDNCRVYSYGADNPQLQYAGLRVVGVEHATSSTCLSPKPKFNNFCFESVKGNNLVCLGDSGAGVYCTAPSNGEEILVGLALKKEGCNLSSTVRVVPVPV